MRLDKAMVKVLFFIETLNGGGAEKVLCSLVNNLDQSRFDITVQTVWPCDPGSYLVPGIRYRSVYPKRNRFYAARYRIEAAAGITYALHMKDDYDIECAYLESGTTKILSGSTNKAAVKLAWVHCDLKKAMPDPEAFAGKTAKYYAKFHKVVCVSEAGRRSFEELFGGRFETVVIHNTVDCEEILRKAQEALPEGKQTEKPLVVSLGRLAAPKHYLRLLQAHKKLLDEGIPHSLWIVGEGPDRELLEQYISQNQLQQSVWLPGFRSNPYPYLKAADLLACSSVYECFSTFVTEGLILGKPILTTDVSGMRELLGDSEYGLITDNEDDAFCEGLRRMLLDARLREQYAGKAAVRGSDFATDKLTEETERFFMDILRDRR